MKQSSYGKRDYIFGQLILTLRTTIGLTQAGLAERLGVSRRAVAEWEAGSAYPKAERLKELIALGVQQRAFAIGREAEEIRAFWKAAHQKLLLDELWLQELLSTPHPRLALVIPGAVEEHRPDDVPAAQPKAGPRMDWGEALVVPSFYGREREVTTLIQWVVQERCRVVSVLGMGGIGKSALAVSLMHLVASHFEAVIWRSLRDAPTCEALLDDCLQVLSPHSMQKVPASLEQRMGLLLEHLREARVLLVLDNLEMLLAEGEGTGHMRAGDEDYARLLYRVAQTQHRSCLLLTSREKPSDLVVLEGNRTPIRALHLSGLEPEACERLLEERDIVGTPHDRLRLVQLYVGNPLALKIVSRTITELFGSEIALFLELDTVIFSNIRELLAEQFSRLSGLEQVLLFWLAIVREPLGVDALQRMLVSPVADVQVNEALDALHRRSLAEWGKMEIGQATFTLQSVVLEYVTEMLVERLVDQVQRGVWEDLIQYVLEQAEAKEYVRQAQERLIVSPLLLRLHTVYRQAETVEERLLQLLSQLREWELESQGYGPTNLISLLRALRGNLRRLDLSRLSIRGAYLQGVEMQDASLMGATLRDAVFTEAFHAIWAVAISAQGTFWATGSSRGEVRVWREGGHILHLAWQAHTDTVDRTLAFSPDERLLATGSLDGTIKLWDVESGALLWTGWHTDLVESLAFAPDGRRLASCGDDATIRLWDTTSGVNVQTIIVQGAVHAVVWSSDSTHLAVGCFDGRIQVWELQGTRPATCVQTLSGHTITALVIAVQAALILFSTFWSTRMNNAAAGTEIIGIVGLTALLLLVGAVRGVLHPDHLFSMGTIPASGYFSLGTFSSVGPFVLSSLIGVYTITGFEAAANLSEETEQAHRVIPFAMLSALLLSGVIGMAFLIALNLASGDLHALAGSATPVADIVTQTLGRVVGDIFLVLVTFSIFACGLVVFMTATRLVWAMSRDCRFPGYQLFRRVDERTNIPLLATIMCGVILEVILAIFANQTATLQNLFSTTAIQAVIIYLATVILYVGTRHKLSHLHGFNLGVFEWPIVILALVWLGLELSIFRDASFKIPWLYILLMFGIGLLYLLFMFLTQREALKALPLRGDIEGPVAPPQ